MPADSVDAICTDPPYGIRFMGKTWDDIRVLERRRSQLDENGKRRANPNAPGSNSLAAEAGVYDLRAPAQRQFQAWCETWAREAFFVLKPGGHLLAFGGTRTYHRMVCAIEDAGFEIRDSVHWVYGSGFPKSLDVSKQIDKMAGRLAEREVVGPSGRHGGGANNKYAQDQWTRHNAATMGMVATSPATEAAQQWQGWGTALKPAHEPICVARKPLSEKNVAQNVLKHSTGALNIDGCRVSTSEALQGSTVRDDIRGGGFANGHKPNPGDIPPFQQNASGRWPPNLLLSHHPDCKPTGEMRRVKGESLRRSRNYIGNKQTLEGGKQEGYYVSGADPDGTEPQEVWECVAGCPVRLLDEQSGELKSAGRRVAHAGLGFGMKAQPDVDTGFGDQGGASRFFPCFEDEPGLEAPFRYVAKASRRERNGGLPEGMSNVHPTVKPIALMRWLVRLVTPPGEASTVLDPFMGSGSTGCAAVLEGFNFIGIEQDESYVAIARHRIAYWSGRTPAATTEIAEVAEAADPTFTGRLF